MCMITTGCHVNNRKWKECADSFYATPPYLQEIYHKDEEKGVRRLTEKYAAEYKRVCGTMGWRDYNVGNLSAMESGDLGVVEVMRLKWIKMKKRQDNFVFLIWRLP